ncbi:MAG: neutral/alkaline non-lysosomal ceramidase N-terminal domain-containing protein, partial [Anaerolineales bacterium]
MRAGTSQVCITPPVGLDLGGYVERQQPSIGIHDDLFVRGLFLEEQDEKLLWLHCDLIGLSNEFVTSPKKYFQGAYGLSPRQVVISVTHTHSGPATLSLRHCGKVDDGYMHQLKKWINVSAQAAMTNLEPVSLYFGEGQCRLARDRRSRSDYPHVDHRLPVVAFRKEDGSYLALLANYAMHNVSLSYGNRLFSADIAGIAVEQARMSLPGKPITLLTNGGSGNTVPTKVSSDPRIMFEIGNSLGEMIIQVVGKSKLLSLQTLS